jgi:hypothetical protein
MSSKRHRTKRSERWVIYERSYLVTLGLAFVALTAFIWNKQGESFSEWPTWSYFLFFSFPVLGLGLISMGWLASRAKIEKWFDAASRHEASVVIMVVAFPVFLLMSLLERHEG